MTPPRAKRSQTAPLRRLAVSSQFSASILRPLLQLFGLLGRWIGGRGIGLPGHRIGRSGRVHSEIPDVKIHTVFAQHLDHRVLTRCEGAVGSHLYPAAGKLLRSRRHQLLLLTDLAVNRDLDVANDAL